MIFATVDENGYYSGTVEADEAPANAVCECPDGCDLKPGAAKWDADRKTFIPVRRTDGGEIVPDATRALVECVCALAEGKPLPSSSMRFLKWYVTTNDGKGIKLPK